MMTTKIAALTAALVLTVTPALAQVGVPAPVERPQPPTTDVKHSGKAYGRYCKGQSRKHVKGQKGTAFSRCVKAMARLDKDQRASVRAACKGLEGREKRGCKKAARKLEKAKEKAAEDAGSLTPSAAVRS